MKKPTQNVLLFDIETQPLLSYSWGIFDQNIIDVKKNWEFLSVAYKWLGEKSVHCITRQGQKDDKALTLKLWHLFDKADVIVAHNGDSFDIRKSNAKFIEYGLKPPSPYVSVDTKKLAKRRFNFNTNRLNDLGKVLGLGEKVHTGGFDLWLGCMAGDKKSWDLMVKYNKQDVILLEKVYLRLRPWAAQHPNMSERGITECPKCESPKLQKRGMSVNRSGIYQQYQCQACGGWCRAREAEKGSKKFNVVNG